MANERNDCPRLICHFQVRVLLRRARANRRPAAQSSPWVETEKRRPAFVPASLLIQHQRRQGPAQPFKTHKSRARWWRKRPRSPNTTPRCKRLAMFQKRHGWAVYRRQTSPLRDSNDVPLSANHKKAKGRRMRTIGAPTRKRQRPGKMLTFFFFEGGGGSKRKARPLLMKTTLTLILRQPNKKQHLTWHSFGKTPAKNIV